MSRTDYVSLQACRAYTMQGRCQRRGTEPLCTLSCAPVVLRCRRERGGVIRLHQAVDGTGPFLTWRLENVRGEFSLTPVAYNLLRAISVVANPPSSEPRAPDRGGVTLANGEDYD